MKKYLGYVFVAMLVMSTPLFTLAQDTGIVGGEDDTGITGGNAPLTLSNPLGDKELTDFLKDIFAVIMIFAVPLIVFMIIYAGFKYVMAQGNPGKVSDANKAIMYALIGGLLILGAWVILEVIQGTVDAFRT